MSKTKITIRPEDKHRVLNGRRTDDCFRKAPVPCEKTKIEENKESQEISAQANFGMTLAR